MLKGTLDDFSLPDIFRLVSFAQRTGRLEVVRRAGHGEVFFRDGQVYYARSSLSREPLGQKLVRAGLLTEGQLNKALDVHAQTGERVGDVLVSSGLVDAEQIESAVRQQIEDAAFDLLRWELGEFTWEAGATIAVEVPIAVSVENLIVEASRRLDELEVIRRRIPSGRAVLKMAATPPEGAAEINITPHEWRALVLVDGKRTVAEIGAKIGLDELDAMKLLHGLAAAGLVELERDAGPEQEEHPGDSEGAAEGHVSSPQGTDTAADAEPWRREDAAADPWRREAAAEAEPPTKPAADEARDPELLGPGERPPAPPDEEEVAGPERRPPPSAPAQAGGDQVEAGWQPAEADGQAHAEPGGGTAAPPSVAVADEPGPEAEGADPFLTDFLTEQGRHGAEHEPVEAAPPAGEELQRQTVAGEALSVAPRVADAGERQLSAEPPATSEAPLAPPAGGPPSREAEAWDASHVDRAAVVRELAGLFDEDAPRQRPAPPRSAPGGPEDGDRRKRVEDDDQVTKGLVSRLIKGVKGL